MPKQMTRVRLSVIGLLGVGLVVAGCGGSSGSQSSSAAQSSTAVESASTSPQTPGKAEYFEAIAQVDPGMATDEAYDAIVKLCEVLDSGEEFEPRETRAVRILSESGLTVSGAQRAYVIIEAYVCAYA